ncbi:ABC transporter ATP-binding protein [Actinophytocola algeriensis]|uniref:Branched-chain amino acid transport system ATP-binding protein n=1 Tax=Actinophytocola algeriensis TaxID=1768010 RepID=A0A7W7QC96_9PSEU|nr:ABC transporter ATP-binding protein [Actinophytocola algeriensis]MBB4910481.1 branched-chain amino acid transport system ATP-binding protein [Actinophytocola algeriensis]MBE1480530.1 branched-chain amino acid transport system ATP-binding protein [Actinophytocola algeriensis]
MLTVTDLRVSYQDAPAVNGVSLSLSAGELVSLVGSNGAGKSSVLAAIAGLHRPIGGSVVFDGRDVSRLPAHAIARLGLALVPEGRRLFAHQTVRANLILGAYLQRDRAVRAELLARVVSLFPVLGERMGQKAGMLSGGEQQMLALGRALMSKPRLLVLDEPSLGIAPRTAELIFDAISQVRAEGVTVLLVEQNLRAALRLSDRLYVLQTGSLVLAGTAAELEESPLIRQAYLGL